MLTLIFFSCFGFVSIGDTVCEIISEELGVRTNQVTPDKLLSDLGADEFDIIEIVLEIEEEFELGIPHKDTLKLKTVGQVIKYVRGRLFGSQRFRGDSISQGAFDGREGSYFRRDFSLSTR